MCKYLLLCSVQSKTVDKWTGINVPNMLINQRYDEVREECVKVGNIIIGERVSEVAHEQQVAHSASVAHALIKMSQLVGLFLLAR